METEVKGPDGVGESGRSESFDGTDYLTSVYQIYVKITWSAVLQTEFHNGFTVLYTLGWLRERRVQLDAHNF